MKRTALFLSVLLLAATAAAQPPDTIVQRIVGNVSEDSVRATIQRLQAFGTRRSDHDSGRAAVEYAMQRMREYGCDTVYPHYFDSAFAPSAVGIKYGRIDSAVEYIICGHIDAVGNSIDSAPGADDNGSGTSVVLEACRVFADEWFGYTVRFICFSAEEGGGLGAIYYAYEARSRGDSILGVLNFDMVGYGPPGQDSVYVAGKVAAPNCSALVRSFCAAAGQLTDLKYRPLMVVDSFIGWDHYAFWLNGYPGLLCVEAVRTPEYHSNGDTLGPLYYEHCGVNNLPMCTDVVRAGVAALAYLGRVNGLLAVDEEVSGPRLEVLLPTVLHSRDLARLDYRVIDALGRDVTDRRDRLAPGVYFLKDEGGRLKDEPGSRKAVRKVVVQR